MDELVKESVKVLRKKLSEVRKKACPKVSGMKKPEIVAEILMLEGEAKRREEKRDDTQKIVEEASKHKPERGRYTSKRKAMAEKKEEESDIIKSCKKKLHTATKNIETAEQWKKTSSKERDEIFNQIFLLVTECVKEGFMTKEAILELIPPFILKAYKRKGYLTENVSDKKKEMPVEKPIGGISIQSFMGVKKAKKAEPVVEKVEPVKAEKPAKGSPEMKEKMAKLRAMRKKKEEK
jgi:hypothetical protein